MTKITLLQWNCWVLEKKENILALLKEVDADIVCLQELTIGSPLQGGVSMPEYLATACGYNQFHKEIPNLAPRDGVASLANGIFSRYPISKTSWQWINEPKYGGQTFDDEFRVYAEAEIDLGSHRITVGTAHVSYTHEFADTVAREAEAATLLDVIQTKSSRYILTGDLNSLPGSYLISNLEKNLQNLGPDYTEGTWTTKPCDYDGFKADTLDWRIDYAFGTRDIRVVQAEIVKTGFSDHLPILVTIEI